MRVPLIRLLESARANFHRAARWGLGASLRWLDGNEHTADDILRHHLPDLRAALHTLELDHHDIERWLSIIEHRLASRQTGARWQRQFAEATGQTGTALTRAYLVNQQSGRPVHTWTVA